MPAPGPVLLTCRYWAFGSDCPNVLDGKNICAFAHWDTGLLAPAYEQRGTCKKWVNGICPRGDTCYYEHRATGLEGMYQGRPDLRGFNHEVKVAAEKAGFNIWNHDGLYNLIWAVKRVALRASMEVNIDDRPPKDPVYPDRFRPSGFRDNTKRKRLGLPSLPATTTPLALNPTVQETQAERRKFRYKNKKVPATSKPTSKYVDFDKQGTQEHPIDLDYEDADDEYDPVAKRQRLDAKATSSTRRAANTSHPRAAQGLPRNIANKGAVIRPSDRVATMQIGGQTYVKTNARGEEEFAAGYGAGESQARQLINQLTRVESAMEGSANHMAWCNRSMSAAFISHREILGGPNIHPLLERLSRSIEEAKSTLLHGAEILKDVAELVK